MMKSSFSGSLKIKASELDLDLTLLGGQSFRWRKMMFDKPTQPKWCGVAYNTYWELTQNANELNFIATPAKSETCSDNHSLSIATSASASASALVYTQLLQRYFRCDFDLPKHVELWRKAHKHFAEITPKMKGVRILDQDPFENTLSFICSQNNNIKRISSLIQWLCLHYGQKIGIFNGVTEYTFPTLEDLSAEKTVLESTLRSAKFGYRAKFLAETVQRITSLGGSLWLKSLRTMPYTEARLQLTSLPGIGFKVADCICLMSLGHLQSVPIDTHIYKIAQREYMPQLLKTKSVTPKIYDEISNHFQSVYGEYAGWAQAVLFCSSLQQFQGLSSIDDNAETKAAEPKNKSKRKV